MRKIFTVAIISFILGIVVFNIIPEHKTVIIAGDIPLLDKRELINNSSVIVKGKVENILPSKWSNPNQEKGTEIRNIVQTDIEISIQDVYKNIPYNKETITVRINSGEIGNTKVISEGYPSFIPGEEVVLFLSEDDSDLANSGEDYYVLTGMLQGKFSFVSDGTKQEEILKNISTIDLPLEKTTFNPATIQEEIENTLEDLKTNPIHEMTKEEIRINNEKIFGDYSQ